MKFSTRLLKIEEGHRFCMLCDEKKRPRIAEVALDVVGEEAWICIPCSYELAADIQRQARKAQIRLGGTE